MLASRRRVLAAAMQEDGHLARVGSLQSGALCLRLHLAGGALKSYLFIEEEIACFHGPVTSPLAPAGSIVSINGLGAGCQAESDQNSARCCGLRRAGTPAARRAAT